jgi:hypothetical protein
VVARRALGRGQALREAVVAGPHLAEAPEAVDVRRQRARLQGLLLGLVQLRLDRLEAAGQLQGQGERRRERGGQVAGRLVEGEAGPAAVQVHSRERPALTPDRRAEDRGDRGLDHAERLGRLGQHRLALLVGQGLGQGREADRLAAAEHPLGQDLGLSVLARHGDGPGIGLRDPHELLQPGARQVHRVELGLGERRGRLAQGRKRLDRIRRSHEEPSCKSFESW